MESRIPAFPKVRHKRTLVEETLEHLSRHILDGLMSETLKPGDRLPTEKVLAEQLQVGRSTLREAIKVLSVLGMIEIRPGIGTSITASPSLFYLDPLAWALVLGHRSLTEIIEARVLIEAETAALAAIRASTEEVEKLQASFQDMVKAGAGQDRDRFVASDVAFHLAVAAASHNVVLQRIADILRGLVEFWISRVLSQGNVWGRSLKEHERILQAIQHHQPQEAEKAMIAHIQSAAATLKEELSLGH